MKIYTAKYFFVFLFIESIVIASQPPLSLREYVSFPNEGIKHFNNRFNATFSKPREGIRHALSDAENRDTLIVVADEINKRYNGNVIVSVGQSPAYIIRAAQLLDELTENSKTEYEYLAFSGKFIDETGVSNEKKEFVASAQKIPTDSQIAVYTRYLKSLRLDPKAIIERYNNKSQKTIFIDFIISARGFASFVYLLNSIAHKQGIGEEVLQQGIDYHVFHKEEVKLNFNRLHIKDSAHPLLSYWCDLRKGNIQAIKEKLIFSLAQAKMNKLFEDRLVPNFPKNAWKEDSPDEFDLSDNAKLLIFKIIHHLADEPQVQESSQKKQKVVLPMITN